MLSQVTKALGLKIKYSHRSFYSIDASQVLNIGKIKDAQIALVLHPKKRIKLTILVVDIPRRYEILLSSIFCKDLGGEIKMDWSYATILVDGNKFILQAKSNVTFIV